jgi:hypothetical protein
MALKILFTSSLQATAAARAYFACPARPSRAQSAKLEPTTRILDLFRLFRFFRTIRARNAGIHAPPAHCPRIARCRPLASRPPPESADLWAPRPPKADSGALCPHGRPNSSVLSVFSVRFAPPTLIARLLISAGTLFVCSFCSYHSRTPTLTVGSVVRRPGLIAFLRFLRTVRAHPPSSCACSLNLPPLQGSRKAHLV